MYGTRSGFVVAEPLPFAGMDACRPDPSSDRLMLIPDLGVFKGA